MAAADISDLETLIKPTGFFRTKAKNIKNRFRPTVSPLIDKVKDDH